jgi:hypothetical protein
VVPREARLLPRHSLKACDRDRPLPLLLSWNADWYAGGPGPADGLLSQTPAPDGKPERPAKSPQAAGS